MSAKDPLCLFLLLVLVPVILAAALNYKRGRVFRARLCGNTDSGSRGIFDRFFVRTFLATLLFCVFLACAVLALAGISWGAAPEPEDKSGLDLVIVLDVSRSMLAADSQPSRLAAAAEIAQGLTQNLSRSRFAAVAFKGGAVLAVPMTEDRQILEAFFQDASPSAVNAPGTSVESGLELALKSFPAGTPSHKAVVLLSDGESLSASSGRSAEKARAEGIPVFTVGMGAEEGSVIRLEGGGLLSGGDGKPVVTRLNSPALKTIASVSQGGYFSFREPGIVSRLTQKLRDFETSRGKMGFRLAPVARYRSFLFAGFLLLCASILARSVKWKKL